jgi:hypothetical protein
MRGPSLIPEIASPARDEEAGFGGEAMQTREVHVATIRDVDRAGLDEHVVEKRHIGGFAFGTLHHGGNQPAQIELRMQLHARVGGPIVGPREDRQPQVDDGGVQGVHRVRQIDRERVVEI